MSQPGWIDGGDGNGTLIGSNGNDTIFGHAGKKGGDALFGGTVRDSITGNGILVGGDNIDTLTATGPRNILIGGLGAVTSWMVEPVSTSSSGEVGSTRSSSHGF